MIFADDIRKTILKLADERGPGKSFRPSEVAMRMDKHNLQGLIDQVRFVANVLVMEGKIKTDQDGDFVHFVKTTKN